MGGSQEGGNGKSKIATAIAAKMEVIEELLSPPKVDSTSDKKNDEKNEEENLEIYKSVSFNKNAGQPVCTSLNHF
tara:strand:+ start:269 stop:493 length:225 start_codon:yes stop_codon:yes gene_type:complete